MESQAGQRLKTVHSAVAAPPSARQNQHLITLGGLLSVDPGKRPDSEPRPRRSPRSLDRFQSHIQMRSGKQGRGAVWDER